MIFQIQNSEPKILVFDESTNSLDSDTKNSILQFIKDLKGKITIISISHEMRDLSDCDRIFKI